MNANPHPIKLFLCGPSGGGKHLVASVLAEHHGFTTIHLSDYCRAACRRLGWHPTRANLQHAGDHLRRAHPAALAHLALTEPVPPDASGAVVVGVRLLAEAEALQSAGWTGIGAWANERTRTERLRRRGEPFDDSHPTEREVMEIVVQHLVATDTGNLAAEVERVVARLRGGF